MQVEIVTRQSSFRRFLKPGSALGVLLILMGALVPAPALIEFLRTVPEDRAPQLITGAVLFKGCLIILGAIVIGLNWLPTWESAAQARERSRDRSDVLSLVILGLILASAIALRLYGLGAGLWHDEILTVVKYVRMPFGEIITTYEDQNQHFLFTLLAHAAFGIFGESAWALRLPAVLFGVASIGALYLLGREVSNSREALLSAALLTFSYHHIWFSQNARGYIGLLFWTILASWLLLRALRAERPQPWLLYAVAAALGVYTNMTMLFVIAGHFIVYLTTLVRRRPNRWAGFFLGFCLAGFFTLFLHSLVLPQVFGGLVGEESTVPAWTRPLWALLEFAKAMRIGFAGGLVALIALAVFGAGFLSYVRTNSAVAQLLVIPTVLCAAVVIGLGHHLWPRFFIFTMGFGALVVMRGLTLLGYAVARVIRLPSNRAAQLGAVFGVGLVAMSALSIPPVYAPKQDYQGALDYIQANRRPGDAVVTVGLATFAYQNYYHVDWQEVKTLDELDAIRARAPRTWLAYTFPPEVESVYPEIMASVKRDFQLQKEFYGTVGSGSIFIFLE